MTTSQEKKQLRQQILAQQKEQPESPPEELSLLLAKLHALPEWQKAKTILLYAPMFGEPNLLSLLEEKTTEKQRRYLFPRIHDQHLTLHEWDSTASWEHGTFGIPEPDPNHWPEVPLEEVDLAFIPGVAFDIKGGRLGRGYGFFDRLFGNTACHVVKCGVGWSWQITPHVPCEPWDILMDIVVTPKTTIRVNLKK